MSNEKISEKSKKNFLCRELIIIMARKPRIHIPGAFYHVMLRGNNRQQIFFDESDYCRFCMILQEAVSRFNCRVHAFCFMPNHIHLALQISEVPLFKIMHTVASRYAIWINNKYKRVGHVFQGRYRSILVDDEKYLFTLIRYIHLNPVKAKIVNGYEQYFWSSNSSYLGGSGFPWVTTEKALNMLSHSTNLSLQKYKDLMNSSDTFDDDFLSHYPISENLLGDEKFKHSITEKGMNFQTPLSSLPTIEEVILFFCSRNRITEKFLYLKNRDINITKIKAEIAGLCVQMGVCTIKEIASLFNKSPCYMSRKIKNLSQQQQERIELLKSEILNKYHII